MGTCARVRETTLWTRKIRSKYKRKGICSIVEATTRKTRYHIRRERAISRSPTAIHRGLFPFDPKWLIQTAVTIGPISPENNMLLHSCTFQRRSCFVAKYDNYREWAISRLFCRRTESAFQVMFLFRRCTWISYPEECFWCKSKQGRNEESQTAVSISDKSCSIRTCHPRDYYYFCYPSTNPSLKKSASPSWTSTEKQDRNKQHSRINWRVKTQQYR